LAELKDKDLQPSDTESVKKAIEDARNAAMKIGQSLNNNQSSSSTSSEEKKEGDEEKKN